WLEPELSRLVGADEWPALLERAPLDLRVNAARAARDDLLAQFPDAEPTMHSPWGIRLASDSRVDDHPAYQQGLVEVQDEGSPLNEVAELSDWQAKADLVVIDAPCSGSGTWRRNPEGRWRLTAGRLERVIALQERLLDIGAALVKPGGRLVYAVCSLLSREGA